MLVISRQEGAVLFLSAGGSNVVYHVDFVLPAEEEESERETRGRKWQGAQKENQNPLR